MSDYPMHGYLYELNGTHGPPTMLNSQDELYTFIRIYGNVALDERREFLIVSSDDNDCFLHLVDGRVAYASGVDLATYEHAIRWSAHVLAPTDSAHRTREQAL